MSERPTISLAKRAFEIAVLTVPVTLAVMIGCLVFVGVTEFFQLWFVLDESGKRISSGDRLQAGANLIGAFLGALLAGAAAIAANLVLHAREQRARQKNVDQERQRRRDILCDEVRSIISWVTSRVMHGMYTQDGNGGLDGSFFKEANKVRLRRINDIDFFNDVFEAHEISDFEYLGSYWQTIVGMIEREPEGHLDQQSQQNIWQNLDHIRRQAADILERYGGEKFRVAAAQAKDDYIFVRTPPLVPLRGKPVAEADVRAWQFRLNEIAALYFLKHSR